MYHPGDYAYLEDLPRRFLCRVVEADGVGVDVGPAQVLKLAPLGGPWPPGTMLIRPSSAVRRAEDVQHTGRGVRPGMGVATDGEERTPSRVPDHSHEAA